jgi:hypothetical protein
MMVRRGLMLVVVAVSVMMAVTMTVNVLYRSGRGSRLLQIAPDQHIDLGRLNTAPVHPGHA